MWAEGRVHNEYGGIRTPVGYIPLYEDLAKLFADIFPGRVYTKAEYNEQFCIRTDNLLAKYARMEKMYRAEPGMPPKFFDIMGTIVTELKEVQAKWGAKAYPERFL